ncbi:hypothetical protein COW64_24210 [bacterium (Candidatus Blackallbacteria) CG18_big_fil_WC_8_21_14_2_50_49_26]|nr:MAG: hypothetical protein COW64_24210 [bacterium (Candidatus Blackallbacteria) CG18_big_fil_WC_8_21_14_2_50_49_26]
MDDPTRIGTVLDPAHLAHLGALHERLERLEGALLELSRATVRAASIRACAEAGFPAPEKARQPERWPATDRLAVFALEVERSLAYREHQRDSREDT